MHWNAPAQSGIVLADVVVQERFRSTIPIAICLPVDINIAIPTSHQDAEKLYRQGNVVRLVGQLDCRMEEQGGEAVRQKLAQIDAEWVARKEELAGRPSELRRAEATYLRVRRRIEVAPRLYVLAGGAELLAGEPMALEETYQARREFVHARRQQQEARRTRALLERAGRVGTTAEVSGMTSAAEMPRREVTHDAGMDPLASAGRPARPRRRSDEAAIADATVDASSDHIEAV